MKNRKFKFRTWVAGQMCDAANFGLEYIFHAEDFDRPVMQSTGIKDRLGNEIFEGDLIKSDFNDKDKSNYVVVWKDAGFHLHHNFENSQFYEPLKKSMVEIMNYITVGNIYENPNLIEKSMNLKINNPQL